MRGGLLVAGTHSDAGKSVVVTGLCRWLARRGVSVAPFKAQNMALNSGVTATGEEIGRAQLVQAAAARVEPEVAMNPVLLKPSGERRSQVVVMGSPHSVADARSYHDLKPELAEVVVESLRELRSRFDVVICEGAGSPAEINLRRSDLANMGLARAAGLPVVVVADIDRGGAFASLFGSLALLEPEDQRLFAAFLINKFRGDPSILSPGLDALRELTGRPTLGVLPWIRGLWLDVEDSLALEAPRDGATPPLGRDGIDVAVVRLRWMSNFTDLDALAAEPGVTVRFTQSPADVSRADLVVLPGTKATVEDLGFVRQRGLDAALAERARRGRPVLAICGGFQMLGRTISDDVESGAGGVDGLGLLPVETRFEDDKVVRRTAGVAPGLGSTSVSGYAIHHGRVARRGGEALFATADGDGHPNGDGHPVGDGLPRGDGHQAGDGHPGGDGLPGGDDPAGGEGCRVGNVLGTSWHGVLESDEFRRAVLAWVADARRLTFSPGSEPFAAVRQRRLDALGDLVERNLDTGALLELIEQGPPDDLPFVPPGAPAWSFS